MHQRMLNASQHHVSQTIFWQDCPMSNHPGGVMSAKPSFGFSRLANWTSGVTGTPGAFAIAVGAIATWAVTRPIFGFSDTWQLVINTGATIITFLMVFLIQNTQSRDAQAMQVKLDEIIRCTSGAHLALLDLEELDEKDLRKIRREYEALAARWRKSSHAEKAIRARRH
jgi:low affinity Fe/Cu permease